MRLTFGLLYTVGVAFCDCHLLSKIDTNYKHLNRLHYKAGGTNRIHDTCTWVAIGKQMNSTNKWNYLILRYFRHYLPLRTYIETDTKQRQITFRKPCVPFSNVLYELRASVEMYWTRNKTNEERKKLIAFSVRFISYPYFSICCANIPHFDGWKMQQNKTEATTKKGKRQKMKRFEMIEQNERNYVCDVLHSEKDILRPR